MEDDILKSTDQSFKLYEGLCNSLDAYIVTGKYNAVEVYGALVGALWYFAPAVKMNAKEVGDMVNRFFTKWEECGEGPERGDGDREGE